MIDKWRLAETLSVAVPMLLIMAFGLGVLIAYCLS